MKKDTILNALERQLIAVKIDTERAKRNAFMAMEYFFTNQVTIEKETLELKKKRKKH